jgi:hypothetical protein
MSAADQFNAFCIDIPPLIYGGENVNKKTQKASKSELDLSKQRKRQYLAVNLGQKIMNNTHKGSTFDGFLEKEKLLDQIEATAIKRVIAHQLEYAMEKLLISGLPA